MLKMIGACCKREIIAVGMTLHVWAMYFSTVGAGRYQKLINEDYGPCLYAQ